MDIEDKILLGMMILFLGAVIVALAGIGIQIQAEYVKWLLK